MTVSRKMGVLISALCLAGAAFAGCGTGQEAPSGTSGQAGGGNAPLTGGGTKIIYIITPAQSNSFFEAEAKAAAEKAKELGYEVRTVSHNEDTMKQSELFDNAVSDKAAAIICDHAQAEAAADEVRKARASNIPTFLIDRGIGEEGLAVSQILANNPQGAREVAGKFVEAMGEQGKYAELMGIKSDANAELRSREFHSVIDQYPEMEMVAQETANWEMTDAAQIVETILQEHTDLKGIICGNDTMALGALESLHNEGRSDIVVVGVDGSDEAAAAIRAGSMTATALQQAGLMAEMAVEQADMYLRTGNTGKPEKQLVDCILITKENVDRLKKFIYK